LWASVEEGLSRLPRKMMPEDRQLQKHLRDNHSGKQKRKIIFDTNEKPLEKKKNKTSRQMSAKNEWKNRRMRTTGQIGSGKKSGMKKKKKAKGGWTQKSRLPLGGPRGGTNASLCPILGGEKGKKVTSTE